ncbi:MAG TPA: TIGR03087 family PEP-CTERM/XrtA system glycosyltransferase, partial [Stellaceae bacterium]|nr:TIGR03087 family PEP-CTERM/XrtA system glycosyltransferase [Stellaceae bacterium]
RGVLARRDLTRVFVFCSSMAPYIPAEIRRSRRCVADLVDVDSEKWLEYARMKSMTTAWLWAREGRLLRKVEYDIACSFDATVVATAAERELLQSFAPEAESRIFDVPNGVDSDYFSPDRPYEAPPEMNGTPLVFTGAMDYWPNADAAIYFARTILPGVVKRIPDAKFFVVGANPTAEVMALADGKQIIVTGRVRDIRPYVSNAKAVVAPLRVARGVQNKVLEGMAMARPVVASPEAAVGIESDIGEGIVVAGEPAAFADAIFDVAGTPAGEAIGRRGRQRVMADHVWSRSLARLDEILDA